MREEMPATPATTTPKTPTPRPPLKKRVGATINTATDPRAPAGERRMAQMKLVGAGTGSLVVAGALGEGLAQLATTHAAAALGAGLESPIGICAQLGLGIPAVIGNAVMTMGATYTTTERANIYTTTRRISSGCKVAGLAAGGGAVLAEVAGSAVHIAPGVTHPAAVVAGAGAALFLGGAVGTRSIGAIWGRKPAAPGTTGRGL